MESRRSANPSSAGMIVTYHAIERGSSPLALDPALLAEHLDRIVASGVPAVTVSELARRLARAEGLPAVAVTFDDGFATVVESAVPLLLERGLPATIFCVAGHIGRLNDWPTDRSAGFRRPLAGAAELADLAAEGFEIGSHGMSHAPLVDDSGAVLRRELAEARAVLEDAVGQAVRSYAFPYGARTRATQAAVARAYDAACTTDARPLALGEDLHALPRVDAHYVRRPELLSRALSGTLGGYLRARRFAGRARRAARPDYRLLQGARP